MTYAEFQVILGNMTRAISADGTIITNLMKGGYDWECEMIQLRRHLLDYFVAYNYNMNGDGTTTGLTNNITAAEFNTLMGKIKKYAA